MLTQHLQLLLTQHLLHASLSAFLQVSVVMSSCWPFCIAGGQILLSYLGRPDVAVLIAEPSDSTDLRGSLASGGREARQGGTATKYEQ